jgi:SSS family solute:Na+ symporter
LLTAPRPEKELVGLVYSLTEKQNDRGLPWYSRPATLGIIVLVCVVALNFVFR